MSPSFPAKLAGRGGIYFYDNDDSNNDGHCLTQQPTCGQFLAGRGVISMMMRTVTTTMKTMNEDNDEDTNCEDNNDLIF